MFWEKFITLCNEKKTTPNAVCAKLNLSTAIATKWKNGATPRDTTLKQLADFFNVDISYFDEEIDLEKPYLLIISNKYSERKDKKLLIHEGKFHSFYKETYTEENNIDFENNFEDDINFSLEEAIANIYIESLRENNIPITYKTDKIISNKISKVLKESRQIALQNADKNIEPSIKPNATILKENIFMIPIFESVSAGFGSIAEDNIIDYTPLYFKSSIEASETICIKVKGDSMYPKIEEGDIIQVHKQDTIKNGDIAVILINENEALVKKILYKENEVELHSINPMYPVIKFKNSEIENIKIIGLVKKIIKNT